jgi:16S rRNA (adenine1518-N6/adenine1519-N6)-dimethyltransferase
MNKHQHAPRKRFGQNFLKDNFIINQIISTISPHSHLVEIGPGLGALTHELIKLSRDQFSAIEIDRDLVEKFKMQFQVSSETHTQNQTQNQTQDQAQDQAQTAPQPNVTNSSKIHIYQSDALKFDFQILNPKPFKIVGNLPYNISTPLLIHLFKYIDHIEDLSIMLQKEVVDRLAAPPNCKDYGRLSVMAQYFCEVTPLLEIPPEAFYPEPKVDSAFVRLTPHKKRAAIPLKLFEEVVREAFHCRRKTLANNLKKFANKETLTSWGINPSLRAEVLTVNDFINLTQHIAANSQDLS